jgi:hypothetical protein
MSRLVPPAIDSEADSQTIIGFTEAELGLVLALVFLVLWLVSSRPAIAIDKAPPTAVVPKDSADLLAARVESLMVVNAALELSLDSLRPKRSRLAPSCAEAHVADGPLFTVRVEGVDSYLIDGQAYTWSGLLEKSALARAVAARAKCRQQIRVSTDPSISAAAYSTALRRLRSEFYTSLLGVELP